MSIRRRIRDETEGDVYYDIDEMSDEISGAGVFDTARALASSIATKLTGKAAKKLATKALEKGAEKVGEKTGEKLGELLGEKIYDRFTESSKSSEREQGERENKGDLIFKELQRERKHSSQLPIAFQSKKLASAETKSISQQFDDLLNLF